MPGFDGTGPLGRGPMTGWGRGFCVSPANRLRYWGFRGFGGGWGRGWRNRYYATGIPGWAWAGYGRGIYPGWRFGYGPEITTEEELERLNEEARLLEKDLEEIRQRMEELKKSKSEESSTEN